MSYLPSTWAWALYNPSSREILPYTVRRLRRDSIGALADLARDPSKPWAWWYRQGFRVVRVTVQAGIGQARVIAAADTVIRKKRGNHV